LDGGIPLQLHVLELGCEPGELGELLEDEELQECEELELQELLEDEGLHECEELELQELLEDEGLELDELQLHEQ